MLWPSMRPSARSPMPSKPQLSLNDLIFAIDLHGASWLSGLSPISITKPCSELNVNPDALFQFDIVLDREEEDVKFLKNNGGDDIKVTWNIVKKDWRIFTMIDGASKQTSSGREGLEKGFTKELPATGCCLSAVESSGIVAELRLQFGKESLEKMTLGLMNTHSWRYVSVDDGLRCLQYFLDRDHHAPKEKSLSWTTTLKN
ncbi:hypothetical protein FNV43_RR16236 [Rhamnella rubrinervis]|uniref:Uncharacterized protein n=1 Tax=Rhamnella rubrinervis TaxID=2594499 RepID=A0A8K0EAI6_9ROSA|nr:hypothetical protein FNV43_RR16236 [Rhamnella rubrinervis]